MIVQLDGRRLTTESSLHDQFARVMGFPRFYGNNMDAWIDCMSSIDAPDEGLSKVVIDHGEVLTLQIEHYDTFKATAPTLAVTLNECAAIVNWRRVSDGKAPLLALAYHG
jgi:hypothetical protein